MNNVDMNEKDRTSSLQEAIPSFLFVDNELLLKNELFKYLLNKPSGAKRSEIFDYFKNNYQFPSDWYGKSSFIWSKNSDCKEDTLIRSFIRLWKIKLTKIKLELLEECELEKPECVLDKSIQGFTSGNDEIWKLSEKFLVNHLLEGDQSLKYTSSELNTPPKSESFFEDTSSSEVNPLMGIAPSLNIEVMPVAPSIFISENFQNKGTINEIDINSSDSLDSKVTQKETTVLARIGQGLFRQDLINYWKGCSVTSCANLDILIASHIKPWSYSTSEERLDKFNGLLLIANIDIVFDKGLISFDENGEIIFSKYLKQEDIALLGLSESFKVRPSLLHKDHKKYLSYHRNYVFQK